MTPLRRGDHAHAELSVVGEVGRGGRGGIRALVWQTNLHRPAEGRNRALVPRLIVDEALWTQAASQAIRDPPPRPTPRRLDKHCLTCACRRWRHNWPSTHFH